MKPPGSHPPTSSQGLARSSHGCVSSTCWVQPLREEAEVLPRQGRGWGQMCLLGVSRSEEREHGERHGLGAYPSAVKVIQILRDASGCSALSLARPHLVMRVTIAQRVGMGDTSGPSAGISPCS